MGWDSIANELNCAHRGGTSLAEEGLVRVLGDEFIRKSVDKALMISDTGSELARSVLIFLHSQAAIDYALQVYRESTDLEHKRSVVSLLKMISNKTVLKWVPEFLQHSDEGIQNWGTAIVDQLVFSGLIEKEDVCSVLSLMEEHPNPQVRWHQAEVLDALSD